MSISDVVTSVAQQLVRPFAEYIVNSPDDHRGSSVEDLVATLCRELKIDSVAPKHVQASRPVLGAPQIKPQVRSRRTRPPGAGSKAARQARRWITLGEYLAERGEGKRICGYLPNRGANKGNVCGAPPYNPDGVLEADPRDDRCICCYTNRGELNKKLIESESQPPSAVIGINQTSSIPGGLSIPPPGMVALPKNLKAPSNGGLLNLDRSDNLPSIPSMPPPPVSMGMGALAAPPPLAGMGALAAPPPLTGLGAPSGIPPPLAGLGAPSGIPPPLAGLGALAAPPPVPAQADAKEEKLMVIKNDSDGSVLFLKPENRYVLLPPDDNNVIRCIGKTHEPVTRETVLEEGWKEKLLPLDEQDKITLQQKNIET